MRNIYFGMMCVVCVLCFFLTACGAEIAGRADVLSGVIFWHNQNWSKATAAFLKSLDSPDENVAGCAVYGLAVSYVAQNEVDSAEARFSSLLNFPDDTVRSAAWYQKGVCEYRNKKYREAADCFRKSLEIEPFRTDAKINLELCIAKDKSEAQEAASASGSPSGVKQSNDAENAVFSLVRKQEEMRWKKAAEEDTSYLVPDY